MPDARRPHAEKLMSTTLNSSCLAEIWKMLCLDPYCCSSKHNNSKALHITFNSCKTVSTSSMALATVNIDKIIKVTSASSYVYLTCQYNLELWSIYTKIGFRDHNEVLNISAYFEVYSVFTHWVHFLSAITDHKQTEEAWSLSCWILLLSIVTYMKCQF